MVGYLQGNNHSEWTSSKKIHTQPGYMAWSGVQMGFFLEPRMCYNEDPWRLVARTWSHTLGVAPVCCDVEEHSGDGTGSLESY